LGKYNGHDHFYTNTGKWFTSRKIHSNFVVKNFIKDPAELKAVIDAIPSLSPSSTVLNELQDLNIGPSRDLAASLIRKMYTFQSAASHIHQTYVERLSHAHKKLGPDEKLVSLREIADALLPAGLKRHGTTFPPEALYAVYSVIDQDDIAFQTLDRASSHHESPLVLLQSASTRDNVYRVEQLVRDYWESIGGRGRPQPKFNDFLAQAQKVIDRSRLHRDWSPHGMVGPRKSESVHKPEPPEWSETALSVIAFMQHWAASAASSGFRSSSRCHWIGASILRALNRYEGSMLDSTTGWTFLQEIGWIPPWDVSARHYLRLPELKLNRHAGLVPAQADATPLLLEPDQLGPIRQEFARATVFCIDSASTVEVDDGISLEDAGDGEYWIHIHVADPASRIRPDSWWATQAALRAQTSYLAGFHQRMFDNEDFPAVFSLGPNRPTLTFSARVNEEGRLLDYKITPGTIRDVVHMTPEDVASVCGDSQLLLPDSAAPVFEVGTRPATATPARTMVRPDQLSRRQLADLKTLSKLADALQRVRVENGAVPSFPGRPTAEVSLDNVVPLATSDGSVHYSGDPYIRVSYGKPGSPLVSSLMQLAGEVAARWCHERDIPIPYRVSVLGGQNLDAVRAFTRDILSSKLLAGETPSLEDFQTLNILVGGFDIAAAPAPHPLMGLEMYTKVTSPLRRYVDLLAHWQIEAALLEEHRSGKSLVGGASSAGAESSAGSGKSGSKKKKREDPRSYLPFSKEQLEESVFPRLRVRERHAKLLDNSDGNSQWILQALARAWHFGDGSSQLPQTFRFTVTDVMLRQWIKGRLDWFDRLAVVEVEHVNNVVRMTDVKPGDVFRVELADVNVHMNKVSVTLLEKIE
jgi:hypothetical protein